MTIHNLSALLQPKAIALIGAPGQPKGLGAVMARNLFHGGFRGPIMPVSDQLAIEGVLAYPSVGALPMTPDLAVICTPLDRVPALIEQLGKGGCRAAIVTAEVTTEPGGPDAQALRQRVLEAARPWRLRVIGPNSHGIISPTLGLNASLVPATPAAGDLALIGQCGTVVNAVVQWAGERNIGFSHVIALGDDVDVDIADMMDGLASDGSVRAILVHLEAVRSARRFLSAARAAARHKPVIVIKAGRSLEATCRASARVGARPGTDEVYDAAFRRAGVLRVRRLFELFDAVQTLGMGASILGASSPGRLAILTDGAGIAVLATDTLIDGGGRLAPLSPDTIERLDRVLPPNWSHGNPVHIGTDAPAKRFAEALDVLIQDGTNDAVLVLHVPTGTSDGTAAAQAVADVVRRPSSGRRRTVLTSWLGQSTDAQARRLFTANRIPTYDTADGAIRGFLQLVEFNRNQELLMETPPSVPDSFEVNEAAARVIIDRAMSCQRAWLSEPETLRVLAAYGIAIEDAFRVDVPEEAASAARTIGRPVALKLRSADLIGRSDFNDVMLNLREPEQVRRAAERLILQARDAQPPITIESFVVQAMAELTDAQEVSIGVTEDRLFGPIIHFGHGGRGGEVLADAAMALPPLNMALARDLMARTRVWRLLCGYRGHKPVNLDALALTLIKVSQLIIDLPEIAQLEIDSLFASERGVLALSARIRLAPPALPGAGRLAIKPYPQQLEELTELTDGTPVLVRPIRPEDEPGLHAMIAAMTPEHLRLRFFAPTRRLSHQTAARMTQIDYDREMAFIVVTRGAQGGEILGVVHLMADPDLKRAEFAPTVRSDRTRSGLGTLLMQKAMSYAASRGIGELYAEVLRENAGMIRLARMLGFVRHDNPDDPGVVEVTSHLDAEVRLR